MPSTTTTTTTDPSGGQSMTITPLATLQPPCSARTWHSAPHPTHPLVATSSSDKTVRVYSLQNFRLASTVSGGHKRSIRCSAWKPGSGTPAMGESVLATGSFDASAGVWRKWEAGAGAGRSGALAAPRDFTDGGEGSEEEEDEYNFAVILDGHESEIKSLAWSAGGTFLATCSRDKSVWIWEELEEDNFETVAVLQEHEADVKCVCWHPEEELLVSASYDDTIRVYREELDDWGCVAVLRGHEATVWSVDFEGRESAGIQPEGEGEVKERRAEWLKERQKGGPRLASSSDDLTVRVWRRVPKGSQPPNAAGRTGIPSILKTDSFEETWVEDAVLPKAHERAVYSVSWSKTTGLIVSTGSDGKLVVYQERWRDEPASAATATNGDAAADFADSTTQHSSLTQWVVVAEFEGAHDVYEINHVTWARRADKGKRRDDEEIIVTTGDDGEVKVWTIDLEG